MQNPAVGIDLGTTNSVVAVSLNGKPQVLTDPAASSSLIPSVLSFPESGERLVGRTARARKAFDPAHTVSSVKRLLGRPFKSEEVRRAKSRVAFTLKEGTDSAVLVETRAGSFSLPEISAMVLREVRRVAETALGHKVDRCVVTVPANFNELQRSSTKIAGKIAELDVVRILNEPTAAALAYGYGRGTREKICIYDFGGGTFDVTLLELNGNVFEVLATWGDTFLGGDDVDMAITDWLVPQLAQQTRIDAAQDRMAYDILRDAAESAKCLLAERDVAQVDFNYMPRPGSAPVRFQHPFSRVDLDRLAGPFVEKTFSVCQEALKLAGMRPSDLTAVILVGGSTRIHSVRSRVAQFFGREPLTHLPPEEVVGLGASILAEALTGGARRPARHTPIPVASQAPTMASNLPPVVPMPPALPQRPTLGAPPGRTLTQQGTGGTMTPSAARTAAPSAFRAPTPPPLPPNAPRAPIAPQTKTTVSHFDLDDPFAESTTRALTPAAPTPAASFKPTPLPRPAPGLDQLDEPSFVGRMPDQTPEAPSMPVQVPPLRRTIEQPTPAFNLEDTSVTAQLPTAPPLPAPMPELPAIAPELPAVPQAALPQNASELPQSSPSLRAPLGAPPARPSQGAISLRTPLGAPPSRHSQPNLTALDDAKPASSLASALAALPPSIAAAIRPPPPKADAPPTLDETPDDVTSMFSNFENAKPTETGAREVSVPSFNLDTAALFDATNTPSTTSTTEKSVPSFRIDPDDIFGAGEIGTGTLVAKSPFESSLPDFGTSASSDASSDVKEESTRIMTAPAVPVAPPAAPPAAPPPPTPLVIPAAPNPLAATLPAHTTAMNTNMPLAAAASELPPMVVPPPVKSPVPPVRTSSAPPASPVSSSPNSGDTLKPSLPPGRMTAPPTPATSVAPPRPSTNAAGIAVPLLLDVTPFSLGVETAGGACESVIRRNATIPVEQTRVFATTNDDQTSVIIRIAQGESRRFSENQILGELELSGLRPAPRGEVSIAVTFELGADGTLSVRAKDVETSREQATRVSLLTIPSESAQADMAARQRTAVVAAS